MRVISLSRWILTHNLNYHRGLEESNGKDRTLELGFSLVPFLFSPVVIRTGQHGCDLGNGILILDTSFSLRVNRVGEGGSGVVDAVLLPPLLLYTYTERGRIYFGIGI